ncbi:AMP-binding protein [Aeromicrobium choanae]|uniref:Long-chain acyl-CoA synthetase n=1 Tax=Aeromicrobium choanae TaxID=1736691 RepID=A0A1T4YX83_9ACTN|nr:AMP-binding protein [Aeromicrobium choanae]SKB06382.1 long-chain acyl-CoA synthetase [Aeromicrobium choanae]
MNIVESLWNHADQTPDRLALRAGEERITYGELRRKIARVAGAHAARGLGPGATVVLVASSTPDFVVHYYALQALGCTVVTMNTMSTDRELRHVLGDTDVSLVLVEDASCEAVATACGATGNAWVVIEAMEESAEVGGLERWHDSDPDHPAVLLYTSGTTGAPKGAELTVANLSAMTRVLPPVLELTEDDRFGTGLPLFHVFGQALIMNTILSMGGSLSLLSPFSASGMVQLIREHRLSVVAGVPTMWNAMLLVDNAYRAEDFADLRIAASGGASLPRSVIEDFADRFRCTILEGYGLTECCGAAAFNDVRREPKVGTVGPALPGVTIRVRDAQGVEVPVGETGEIHVSGPIVMRGYHGREEATAETLVDGELRTGDLGFLDEDGYLTIVDRAKDLIIRGGYNVYPREVEEVLYSHPDVVEAAVIGVPDTHLGEEIGAVVVLADGSATTVDDLRELARRELSAYKIPRLYTFVETLPKGATGKILKRHLASGDLFARA